MPAAVRHVVETIAENCEPALLHGAVMAGAGGSLRAGVTEKIFFFFFCSPPPSGSPAPCATP